jgi:2-polyprenyl-3-methyl-5-hydroxy-6-metoxy-1,4-benzoquinol methylase
MLFANPAPADFASGDYYDRSAAGYYLSAAKLESDYAAVRFERELRLFHRHCKSGAVLDVGCSTGAFLHQLQQRFPRDYEVCGTDASGPALEYAASQGVSVVRGDFLKQDFAGKQFDAVTFWAILEHLLEPRGFLEKAWTVLKPNGLCFVLVPNMQSLAARMLAARYRYIYPQHLNYFTATTLTRIFATQFKVVERDSTHFNPLIIWQDWRRRGAEISNEERAQLLQRTTSYKQKASLAPARFVYRFMEKTLGVFNLADNLTLVLRKNCENKGPGR